MLYFHRVDGNCKNYRRTVLPSIWKESELPAKTVVPLYSIFWKFRIPLHPTFLVLLLALPGLRQLVVGFSLPGPGFFPCQPMWTFWLAACYFNRFIWVLVFHGHCHSTSNITFIDPHWYIILANVSGNYIQHFTLSVSLFLVLLIEKWGRSLS